MSSRPRLLLVGVGHAHIEVLRRFGQERPHADLLVLSERSFMHYSGMVPGLIGGRYTVDDLTIDIAPLIQRAGATLHTGRMAGLDARAQIVHTEAGDRLPYDLVSFNLGAVGVSTGGGVADGTTTVRPISPFLSELQDVVCNVERGRPLVIVGGGAAGIELACAFATRKQPMPVTLVEAQARILPMAPGTVGESAAAALRSNGVHLLTGRAVEEVDDGGLILDDGSRLGAGHVLWATAARGAGWFAGSGLEVDADGFVRVSRTLATVGAENCFAAGDCASLSGFAEVPRSGAVAVHQGPLLARNLRRVLEHRALAEFRPKSSYLTLLNLGRGYAAGYKGNLGFHGLWVMRLKDKIDRRWVARYR